MNDTLGLEYPHFDSYSHILVIVPSVSVKVGSPLSILNKTFYKIKGFFFVF